MSLLVLSLCVLFLVLSVTLGDDVGASPPPNILLLLTDDQDVTLGSFDHMPFTKRFLQEEGMTFENAFVHTPVCCPSRSSILTGRYLHHAGVKNNSISGNCYGTQWREDMEPDHTIAVHAKKFGYSTAYAGKYLNQYGFNHSLDVPAGWDQWMGLKGNSIYYNYTLIHGGTHQKSTAVHHGDHYPNDYLPHVLQNKAMHWIDTLPEPWLIVVAWPTPHGPFTPAPWAAGTMKDQQPPTSAANYNASAEYMQQKHWLLRQLHPLSNQTASQVTQFYQMRLEALKSIDEYQAELMMRLEELERLDRTVVLYTSDNGFQFGQHRLAMDKRHLYESDIRVPFCIRGPGVLANTTTKKLVANIDIGPTMVDIMSHTLEATKLIDDMDGISFWNHARGQSDPTFLQRSDILITYHGEGQEPCGLAECPPPLDKDSIWWMPDSFNNTYNCVRTISSTDTDEKVQEDSIYCRFDDSEEFVEFYDLSTNPLQLSNDANRLDPVQKQRYEHRLHELRNNEG